SGSSGARGGSASGEIGDAYDAGGLGLSGNGEGGGGEGEGTIGLGNMGTIGRGGGSGDGWGYGEGHGGLSGRTVLAPDVTIGTAYASGALDKELIRRVVRAHINEVIYCYESALKPGDPLDIFMDRLPIHFAIAPTGEVLHAEGQYRRDLGARGAKV